MVTSLLLALLALQPVSVAQDTAAPTASDTDEVPDDAYPTGGQTVACAQSPGLPLGLAVVALAALATRRRRPVRRRVRRATGVASLTLIGATVASPAHAGDPTFQPRLDLQRFEPCGLVGGFATTCTGKQLDKGKVSFVGTFSYGWRPFQQSQRIADTLIRRVEGIDHLTALHLGVQVGATRWLQVGLSAPAVQVAAAGPAIDAYGPGRDGNPVGAGDLRLDLGFRAVDTAKTGGFGLAVTPFATFPTGSRRLLLTDGTFGFGGQVAMSGDVSIVHLAAHAGYLVKVGGGSLGDHVAIDDEVRWGAGVGVDLLPDKVRVNAEVLGASIVGPWLGRVDHTVVTNKLHTAAEADVDFVVSLPDGFAMTFGGGAGLTPSPGVPIVRGFVGFGYVPWTGRDRSHDDEGAVFVAPTLLDTDDDGVLDADDQCPDEKEDRDGHLDEDGCFDADDDGDGVPDETDRCRDLPEDLDGNADTDGCPDFDDDLDGIRDEADLCPLVAEDLDGVEDGDGCPEGDLDSDGDGLLDPADGCPAIPEDVDGFADEDGCPEADNDGDGLLDGVDRCPNEAEVRNGVDDDDGCPDEGKARIAGDRIEILERVLFYTDEARIRPDSFGVLDAVVGILQQYPDVKRVRIEGHTDSQGSEDHNQDLSERRALSVRQYLIDHGISPTRLLARGYGELYPIAPNGTDEGRAINRRVDFVILGPEDEGGL